MKRSVFSACLGAVVIAAAASLALGADKEKKQDAKAATMGKEMYTAGCPDPCSFSVQSRDKAEVVSVLQQHAKNHHNMSMSAKEAEGMVKTKDAKSETK